MSGFYQSTLYQNFFSLPSTVIKTISRNCGGRKFEPEVKALETLVKPGSYCFDVGGAYGRYAFPLSRMVGPQGRIYSFEPGSYSWKVFQCVKIFFGLRNVVLTKKAVSDKLGSIELCLPSKRSGKVGASLAYVHSGPQADSLCETVEMVTLDDFATAEKLPRLDLIKCDTEGSELAVFHGARASIERFQPVVLTEIDAANMARYQRKVSDMLDFFGRLKYRLMIWNGTALVPETSADQPGNYFFIPANREV